MSIASYPHVDIHVKDNSIFNAIATENLPLHKPLYMMRCYKGPVGVPVWCPAYSTAKKVFGANTFDKRAKKYYSNQAYFLTQTFPMGGAFVMRVADTTAKTAELTIEVGILENYAVKQKLRDENGKFVTDLDGSTAYINAEGKEIGYVSQTVYDQVAPGSYVEEGVEYFSAKTTTEDTYTLVDKSVVTKPVAGTTYYTKSGNTYTAGGTTTEDDELVWAEGDVYTKTAANSTVYELVALAPGNLFMDGDVYYTKRIVHTGTLEEPTTINGLKVVWRARVRTAQEKQTYALDEYHQDTVTVGTGNDAKTWKFYPVFNVVADSPGVWGQKYGLKVYFDPKKNTLDDTIANGAVTLSVAPVELVGDDTTPTPVIDAYGMSCVEGVMRPGVVNPVTDLEIDLGTLIPGQYSGNYKLPVTIYPIPKSLAVVGEKIMAAEIAARNDITTLYAATMGVDPSDGAKVATFVDQLFEKTCTVSNNVLDAAIPGTIAAYDAKDDENEQAAGFMANAFSLLSSNKVPYFASELALENDPDVASMVNTGTTILTNGVGVFVPGSTVPVYLAGGDDGKIEDWNIASYIEAYVRSAENQTQEYLNDYARCPFNSFMDTGVPLSTKKAYLDMLDVRDSLVVNLSTQVTWKAQKKVGSQLVPFYPALNTRYEDESIGSALRAYAWLMKEDIENGTECCRAVIFTASGKRSDYKIGNGWIPATLFIAMQKARFLNKGFIDQEVKELPNSSVDCFTEVSWVAFSEDTKARCWNNGLNYLQYYDMTHYHYASVRSVYRYDTSILSDAGVVDAICFLKDECRREWARWAGSTRKAAELNKRIDEGLQARFSYVLNGKYEATPKTYQTDLDMKLGYARHVDVNFTAPGQNRVWKVTIECNRENFNPAEA